MSGGKQGRHSRRKKGEMMIGEVMDRVRIRKSLIPERRQGKMLPLENNEQQRNERNNGDWNVLAKAVHSVKLPKNPAHASA